jgi:hypothetical protein
MDTSTIVSFVINIILISYVVYLMFFYEKEERVCPSMTCPKCPELPPLSCPKTKCPAIPTMSCPTASCPELPPLSCPEVSCPEVSCPELPPLSCPEVSCPELPPLSCPEASCPEVSCPEASCPVCEEQEVCPEPKRNLDVCSQCLTLDYGNMTYKLMSIAIRFSEMSLDSDDKEHPFNTMLNNAFPPDNTMMILRFLKFGLRDTIMRSISVNNDQRTEWGGYKPIFTLVSDVYHVLVKMEGSSMTPLVYETDYDVILDKALAMLKKYYDTDFFDELAWPMYTLFNDMNLNKLRYPQKESLQFAYNDGVDQYETYSKDQEAFEDFVRKIFNPQSITMLSNIVFDMENFKINVKTVLDAPDAKERLRQHLRDAVSYLYG